jgi:Mn2+/Fe2+ NRAMP family transporter
VIVNKSFTKAKSIIMKKLGVMMAAAMLFVGTATFANTKPVHTAKAAQTTQQTAKKTVHHKHHKAHKKAAAPKAK